LRANRTIHIEVSLLGYDAQRKARRGRACLQFLPTVCGILTTILAVSRFDLAHVRCTMRPIGLIFLTPAVYSRGRDLEAQQTWRCINRFCQSCIDKAQIAFLDGEVRSWWRRRAILC